MATIDLKTREITHPLVRDQTGTAPDAVLKVDLDERAFAFPQAKQVTQLHILAYRPHRIALEATYAYNESRDSHQLFELPAEDARELVRRLVETDRKSVV